MKTSIAIVDYGMGNLRSVYQALRRRRRKRTWRSSSEPEGIRAADRVVLPGQGAMPDCMRSLGAIRPAGSGDGSRAQQAAAGRVRRRANALRLERRRRHDGPGLLPGKVVRFQLEGRLQDDGSRFKVPQMGWNRVRQAQPPSLWDGVADGAFFYFVHSYYVVPDDPAPYSRAKRLRRTVYLRRSRATISSRPSFTRKRAPTRACACIVISCTGIRDSRGNPVFDYANASAGFADLY